MRIKNVNASKSILFPLAPQSVRLNSKYVRVPGYQLLIVTIIGLFVAKIFLMFENYVLYLINKKLPILTFVREFNSHYDKNITFNAEK